ncbi:hypothetical protein ACFWIP_26735, partial [Streptomyces anulatus]
MTQTEIKTNDRRTAPATTVRSNTTTSRLDFAKTAPKVFRAVIGLDAAARGGREPPGGVHVANTPRPPLPGRERQTN